MLNVLIVITDNKLLKQYNKIWERASNLLSIKFDSEPDYGDNDKYIKTKIKLCGDKIKYKLSRQKNTKRKRII